MAATKPDKTREETYDFIVSALQEKGRLPLGRSKEGLVYENHLDGEHIVIKVIKKKDPVAYADLTEITTYKEKIEQYQKDKENKETE
jgi:hypothetical protein